VASEASVANVGLHVVGLGWLGWLARLRAMDLPFPEGLKTSSPAGGWGWNHELDFEGAW
jgi:hypothetical protein